MNLVITISPTSSGGVDLSPNGTYVSPGKVSFPAGTVVSLTAIDFITGSTFDHWEGSITGTANPAKITMNSDKAVTAVFGIPPGADTVNLTTGVTGSGSVLPASGIFNRGDWIILTAVRAEGYVFDSWSGNLDSTSPVPGVPNALNVFMGSDRYIVANFVKSNAPPPPGTVAPIGTTPLPGAGAGIAIVLIALVVLILLVVGKGRKG